MSPTKGSRVYSTRHRARQENKEARYDDIFSAVTRAVQDEDKFGGISRRLIEENSMPVRMRLFSQSSHSSTSSDDESEREAHSSVMHSSSGRPQRRAALVARSAFEAVETIEEATEEVFEQMMTSHSLAVAAQAAKRKELTEERERSERRERERTKREDSKARFACTQCPLYYDRHMQLHKHIMEKHAGTGCAPCKLPWRVLRQRHECFKCGNFAANLDKHLVDAHYAVSSRRGALLECGLCSRTFDHLKEVILHEKTVHGLVNKSGASKKAHPVGTGVRRNQFHCRACGDSFDSRYLRDQHLTKHFQSVIESVWRTIEQMQEDNPERFLMNQCPLCGYVMSSRKSFRTHVIHRHLMYDGSALERLVGPGVKQEELLTVQEHIALEGKKKGELPPIPVSAAVKEEVHDMEEKTA